MGLFDIFKKREATTKTVTSQYSQNNTDEVTINPIPNDTKFVSHSETKRILNIFPDTEKGYYEKYYSIDMSTGALCITDHSFAGGYGGGYWDYIDKLERYDIPYDELTEYCKTASPILSKIFKGIQKDNCFDYLEMFESLPRNNRFLSVSLALLNRRDFAIEKTLQIYDDFCIHLCRRNNNYILVLECITYKAMVTQWYMLLKEVDIENENIEILIAYTDSIIKDLHGL